MRASSTASQSNHIVSMADLVSKALRRTPAKVSQTTMTILCKVFSQSLQSGHPELINELVDFHAARVNPRNLVITPNFFGLVQKEEGLARAPFLKHYLILTQYTEEKTRATTTGPSQAQFLEAKDITNLGKKADWVKSLEALFAEARSKYLPLLEARSSKAQARLELAVLTDLCIRCALAKPWPESLKGLLSKTPTGKFSQEKAETLKHLWATWYDSKSNASTFAKDAGLFVEPGKEAGEPMVDLGDIDAQSCSSGVLPPMSFKRGDEVTLVRRITSEFPIGGKDLRRDLQAGTTGVVEGWADTEQRKILLKLVLSFEGQKGPREFVRETFARNVVLSSEYNARTPGDEGETDGPPSTSGKGKEKKRSFEPWLLLDSHPENLREDKRWSKVLADKDKLIQIFWTKGRVAVCLETLHAALPSYTEKDFHVVHRANSSGVWKCELWTKRDFAPRELVLGPFTSSLKESHVTSNTICKLGLPAAGPGAAPEGLSMNLDGRFRTSLASKDILAGPEQTGSLFWLVQRTSDKDKVNLVLENVTFSSSVSLEGPWKKARHTSHWESKDLPSIPVLINKKIIKAHERLATFMEVLRRGESKESN